MDMQLMKKERFQHLEKYLAVFQLSLLQDFVTFYHHCRSGEIEVEEVAEFIRQKAFRNHSLEVQRNIYNEKIQKMIVEKFPRCPLCGQRLSLEEINNHPRRMIDGHSHSWWVCSNMNCEFEPELSDKFPYEILSDLGIPVHKPIAPRGSLRRERAAASQRSRCGGKKKG